MRKHWGELLKFLVFQMGNNKNTMCHYPIRVPKFFSAEALVYTQFETGKHLQTCCLQNWWNQPAKMQFG